MTVKINDRIFREYDIRGKFGDDLTIEVAELLGAAIAKTLGENGGRAEGARPRVSVGRDVRLSSTALRDAICRGLTLSGVDCVDIGECPTPLQYFSLHRLGLDGGVMITGSHNPPEYNGFKVSIGKETIHGPEIQRMKEVMKGLAAAGPAPAPEKGGMEKYDVISSYSDFHAESFGAALGSEGLERPVKVVLDSGNGTAGLAAPGLLRRLGCDVVELFSEPDGTFPNHHPDPTVEKNLAHLIAEVRRTGADFGVGYDGDADRIGAVDEKGGIIWGDQLMIIFARSILGTKPGATIVGEVKCSQVLYDEITRLGGNAVMWKTGHSLIKSRMKELGAAMAGEMSGHIFFADRYFGFDDAIYATARLVEILAAKRRQDRKAAFSGLLAGLPATFVTPEYRVDCPDEEKFAVIERLKKGVGAARRPDIRDVIDIDGLRVVFEGGWALVRASNTQPVLVMRYEAESEGLLEEYKSYIRERLAEASPSMSPGRQ